MLTAANLAMRYQVRVAHPSSLHPRRGSMLPLCCRDSPPPAVSERIEPAGRRQIRPHPTWIPPISKSKPPTVGEVLRSPSSRSQRHRPAHRLEPQLLHQESADTVLQRNLIPIIWVRALADLPMSSANAMPAPSSAAATDPRSPRRVRRKPLRYGMLSP